MQNFLTQNNGFQTLTLLIMNPVTQTLNLN
jgi:hypothetical protein